MSKICSAVKKDGKQCSYKVKEGDFCGVHSKTEKKVKEEFKIEGEIRFYKKEDDFYCFSNFFPCTLIIDDIKFLSVEHYFQSMKFKDEKTMNYFKLLTECDSPAKCKELGSQKSGRFSSKWLVNKTKPELGFVSDVIEKNIDLKIRDDWLEVRDKIMMIGLKAKFEQCREFKLNLLFTKDSKLIENSPTDKYWGCGKDNLGKNRLGELLMELRDLNK